jgi:hypothetical protein
MFFDATPEWLANDQESFSRAKALLSRSVGLPPRGERAPRRMSHRDMSSAWHLFQGVQGFRKSQTGPKETRLINSNTKAGA